MLRNTGNTESIIVEYGFLDSSGDDVNQLKNNYKDYAEAVVRALADYIGATYIPVAGSGYYVVQKGDSLWSIAKKLGTTVDELKRLNNLTSNNLAIGQTLKIPGESSENNIDEFYIVKSGDTLYSIARENGLTVQDIINLNNLTSTNLKVGQRLRLKQATPSTTDNENIYTVVKGDSLYAIANRYGITVQDIIDANNLSTTALSVGQRLIIPTSKQNDYEIYTVVAGDSLYSIANRYGVTVNSLKELNNLSSNTLSIGQKLKIPSKDNYLTYTVQKGDSLYSISREYGTTVSEIQSINNLSTSNLSIGQKLLIPRR